MDALRKEVETESLPDYECNECGKLTHAEKTMQYKTLPPIIVFQVHHASATTPFFAPLMFLLFVAAEAFSPQQDGVTQVSSRA